MTHRNERGHLELTTEWLLVLLACAVALFLISVFVSGCTSKTENWQVLPHVSAECVKDDAKETYCQYKLNKVHVCTMGTGSWKTAIDCTFFDELVRVGGL